jgi:hypothetical protein
MGVSNSVIGRTDRRQAVDQVMKGAGIDTDSFSYGAGKLGSEIAGTAGMGGLLAKVLGATPGMAAGAGPLLEAIATSGMRAGGATGAGGVALRAAGGAFTGGASAGLVNPEDVGAGAVIGGAFAPAAQGVGKAAQAIGSAVRGKPVAPEVAALAQRAKELGIDIPADRLTNSRPLNAIAAGLNYVPFSGRAAVEDRMASQLNQALSKTFGQDSSNVTQALRAAENDLGQVFDKTLKNTGVAVDKQLLEDLARVYNRAESELGSDALKPIASQLNELMAKAETGVIDGQAAYNIKRNLDRIGRSNTPTAYHALELKGSILDALNRSLGPDGAAAFAKTREQYSNMLALQKLAKNGAEGEVSAARLANMQNINNQPLQELADIAAQFVKNREGQHGAAQRAAAGAFALGMGGVPGLAAGAATGRGLNMLLNSETARQSVLGGAPVLTNRLNELLQGGARIAPLLSAQ